MTISDHPLHRSRRALLTHRAPASGDDAKPPQRIGVVDADWGQPALGKPLHPLPGGPALLAAPTQGAIPVPDETVAEQDQRSPVHRNTVIPHVPHEDRAQPLSHRRDRVVQALPEFHLQLLELRLQPLTHRLAQHREAPVAPLLPADMREAEEAKCLWLPLTPALPIPGRERTEFDEPGLVGMQFQSKLGKSLPKVGEEKRCLLNEASD